MDKISKEAYELMSRDSKIGVVATTDDEGAPHLTFITSLQSLGERQITFGRFCEGLSKGFIQKRPDARFLALGADMRWLRGAMRFTHTENTGAVFDEYNNKPLFRYNSYFGFNRIFFHDLTEISPIEKLPMASIVCGAVLSKIMALSNAVSDRHALSHVSRALFSQIAAPKFLCWKNQDGLSDIVPIVQATPAGQDRVVFSSIPYGADLKAVPIGAKAAILCVNMQMQSVLVKGAMIKRGVLSIERVYNSMPPQSRYVFPVKEKPEAVTVF